MATDPKTDPKYLGRIDYPEYNCYVFRQAIWEDLDRYLVQTLYRLDTDEEVEHMRMPFDSCDKTAEDLLDNALWEIDREASRRRYKAKQQIYFSGPYQEMNLEEKMTFWFERAHYYKRVSFEMSDNSSAIVVLNKGWLDQQNHYNTAHEIRAIVAYMVQRNGLDPEISEEMLKHGINSAEWAEWNQKQIEFVRSNEQ